MIELVPISDVIQLKFHQPWGHRLDKITTRKYCKNKNPFYSYYALLLIPSFTCQSHDSCMFTQPTVQTQMTSYYALHNPPGFVLAFLCNFLLCCLLQVGRVQPCLKQLKKHLLCLKLSVIFRHFRAFPQFQKGFLFILSIFPVRLKYYCICASKKPTPFMLICQNIFWSYFPVHQLLSLFKKK